MNKPDPAESARRLEALRLKPGDIAIDCGANVGHVTAILARSGATVYAFEPNPHAFEVLQKRFASTPSVVCLRKGVLDEAGAMKLYLHQNAGQDQVYWSQGGSLLDFKGNVNRETFVEVEIVDLADFILKLGRPVRVLKMDVEGVECRILKRLILLGLAERIEHIFVETHEQKIPQLRPEVEELRDLIGARGLKNIDLNWL
ncbi:MAG: FkbM family methyltransferase [Kiritimatiellia bacterium]